MSERIKIGIFGVGHLGKIHIKCLQMLTEVYDIIGFYDPDDVQAQKTIEEFQLTRFSSEEELIANVEVADIVTPTISHFSIAKKVLLAKKHLFIEKPITHSLEEADELLQLSEKQEVKAQVGHVERFNPALLALEDRVLQPMFIEAHRLAMFNPRGMDVSVVLDLMIHDLDILLHLVDAEIHHVSASGVAVAGTKVDIANARIEFENGCVANVTASRISLKQMRKMRLFQRDAYVSLDFLEKKAQIVQLENQKNKDTFLSLPTPDGEKWISVEEPDIQSVNAIKMELATFAESINNDLPVKVTIKDGCKALHLAHRIVRDIELRQEKAQNYF